MMSLLCYSLDLTYKVMFSKSAKLYDRIYRSLKDYEDDLRKIYALLERHHGSAQTVLDVACAPVSMVVSA